MSTIKFFLDLDNTKTQNKYTTFVRFKLRGKIVYETATKKVFIL